MSRVMGYIPANLDLHFTKWLKINNGCASNPTAMSVSASKYGNRGHMHMEVCCHTEQDKYGKGEGKSVRKREGVHNIGDQPDQGDVEGSEVSEDDEVLRNAGHRRQITEQKLF
ncbi:hypothetical protein ACROYT_G043439 [Oculina patagonica]